MPPLDFSSMTPEEIQAEFEKVQKEAEQANTSVTGLTKKRDELLIKNKRLKTVANLIKAAGLDPEDDDVDEKFAGLIAKAKPLVDDSGDDDDQTPDQKQKAAESFAGLPSDAVAAILELKQTNKQIMRQLKRAEEEKQKAIEKQRQDRLERTVIEEYSKLGVEKPHHLFKLTKDLYRLDENGENVLAGNEYDPVSVSEQAAKLKDDDEFGVYFRGSGMSGSGMTKESSITSNIIAGNPFIAGSANATQAALLMKENPQKGRQLMAQAAAAGKLDPMLKKVYGGH